MVSRVPWPWECPLLPRMGQLTAPPCGDEAGNIGLRSSGGGSPPNSQAVQSIQLKSLTKKRPTARLSSSFR